jgi:hypothetical protein
MASRIADIARDDDGVAVSGASVSLRRESDNFELATTTTDANGYFAFSEATVGYPGPVKVVVTDVNGNVRQHSGRSTGQVGTIFMSDLNRAFLMMTDGIIGGVGSELAVTTTGLTMNLTIGSGECFVYGHPCVFPATSTVTPAANASGNPRIDLIVVRLIPPGVAEEGKRTFALVQGTPAASPVTPSATKDPNVKWEVALASVRVESGATSITSDKIVDLRGYSSGPLQNSSVTTAILNNLSVTTAKVAAEAITVAKMNAEGQFSNAAVAKVLKAPTSGNPPVFGSISTSELVDVSEDVPTNNQVLTFDTTDSRWKPKTPPSSSMIVQEGGVTVTTGATIINFNANDFDVTGATGTSGIALATDSVGAAEIAAGAVGSAELAAGAVIAGKLGADSVTATEIAAGAVGSSELATGAVIAGKIATDAVTATEIAALAVGTAELQDASVTNVKVASGIDAVKIGSGVVSNTEFQTLDGIGTTAIATQLAGKAATAHTHTLTSPPAGFATKTYTFTGVTSTAADGIEIAGFDLDVPSGGGMVTAHCDAQCGAPSATGTFIEIGVKIGSQSTDWGMRTQTVGGERDCSASSTRLYATGAAAQRISLRARVDAGTGAGVNAANIFGFCVPVSVS